jgi:hypothetical protein
MAKARKTRIAVCGVVAGGLLAMLAGASAAAALSLPSLTVSVPVTTPTLTVQAPPPPVVKTPTISVPLEAPPPPVQAPTVPVKAPTVTAPKVTVKAPTVTVKATTTASTSPTVSVKAALAGVPAPSVSVKASGGSAGGSLVTVKASSPSATSSNGSAASSRSATRSGSTGAAGANQSGSGSGGLGGAGGLSGVAGYGLGPGYAELPALAGRLSHRARARIAARERSLKAMVAQLHGCLSNLPESQRRLLELRTGLGSRPLGPQAAAARLHVGPHRFAELERRAVRELRASANTRGCGESAGQVASGVISFIGAAFGAGPGEMHGGLQPVSYNLDPRSLRAFLPHAHLSHDGSLGGAISPAATNALLALLLTLIAIVVLAIVVVGAAGRGPRDPDWRRRAAARIRSFH